MSEERFAVTVYTKTATSVLVDAPGETLYFKDVLTTQVNVKHCYWIRQQHLITMIPWERIVKIEEGV